MGRRVQLAEALFGVDAWISLGAAAMVTERIALGTLLTPVSRWKPWDLASRVGTVDRLLEAGPSSDHERRPGCTARRLAGVRARRGPQGQGTEGR